MDVTIARRLPKRSENAPTIMPPVIAPIIEITLMIAVARVLKWCCRCKNVGKQVLRAVRAEVHDRHQRDEIKESLPIRANQCEIFLPAFSLRGGCFPRFAFLDTRENHQGQQSGRNADEKHRTPSPARENGPECNGCEQISKRVPFLQNS